MLKVRSGITSEKPAVVEKNSLVLLKITLESLNFGSNQFT
jgi:hypothetical protein